MGIDPHRQAIDRQFGHPTVPGGFDAAPNDEEGVVTARIALDDATLELRFVNHRTFFERPSLPYDHARELRVT